MVTQALGYQENPKDKHGIVRARTTGQVRSWEIPRTDDALEQLEKELGRVAFPGNYILFEGKNKVYVGQAKDVVSRLRTHAKTPEDKIQKWDRAIIVNDGRSAGQSDFNDDAVRKALELHLIELFRVNRCLVVAQGERQNLNPMQLQLYNAMRDELDFLLRKKTLITKLLEKVGEEEVLSDQLKRLLKNSGRTIQAWGAYEATIDGEKVFVRPGSKKPRGWQITFRGRKPGSFIDSLQRGSGLLLVPRDGVLLIPLKQVQKVIADETTYQQDTIDIWIAFTEERVTLRYKDNIIDVTDCKLVK